MDVRLAYGREGLIIDLPDDVDIIRSRVIPGFVDPKGAILDALACPIQSLPFRQMIRPGMKVVIAHSDITRATPNQVILPVILQELELNGIAREDITILCALGTHRQHSKSEMRHLLGDHLLSNYRCIQHDAYNDNNLVSLGKTCFGNPIRLNRSLVEADLKVLTGFIEPHFFAGFSGGAKCVLPGLAGAESVISNHGLRMIGDKNANFGITQGNPIWEEMMDFAETLSNTFLLNVTMNSEREITGVFGGEVRAAHLAGCDFVRSHAMVEVPTPYDIVITTNNGFPLDQNLYQSSKGMRAAERIVRKGGAIIIATACEDGIPADGNYASLIQEAGSIEGIWNMLYSPGFFAQDQWQLQIQAMLQEKADIYVFSDGLTEEEIRKTLFIPCKNIPGLVNQLRTRNPSRICVLPEGPLVIPYLRNS